MAVRPAGLSMCFAPIAETGQRSASTVAPTFDRRQMWSRSASSPSEMSMALVASPRSAWPSDTRGVGSYRRITASM